MDPLILLIMSLVTICSSQLIIPKRPLGYVYAGGNNDATVYLDIHMGPLCSDSRDAFQVAKEVADHYGATTLKLTLHMFPLPYHYQAYLTAKGAEIVRMLGAGDAAAYKWFQYIYENLDTFSNSATANMTTNDVIMMLSKAAHAFRIDPVKFQESMDSWDIERETRAAWKYSCTRGIASAPTFLLNDIMVAADPKWTLNDWKQVIDPLLQGRRKELIKDCPADSTVCEYLPGKVKCCTKGDACIRNVGCRCYGDSCSSENMYRQNIVKIIIKNEIN